MKVSLFEISYKKYNLQDIQKCLDAPVYIHRRIHIHRHRTLVYVCHNAS